tara:strand:+ start:34 stop:174 length:141 start_codon:yes stop_codon:yes gene_type:complete
VSNPNTKKNPISPPFTDEKRGENNVKDMSGCLTLLPVILSIKRGYK